MSLDGQRVDPARYSLIPRTLSFLIRNNQVLLMRLGKQAAGWDGQYNGLGGHLERGEHPRGAAQREVLEESGLETIEQRLCGVVTVDTGGNPGIGLYVFVGEVTAAQLVDPEPDLEWIDIDQLENYPLIEDLPTLLPAALEAYASGSVFSAATSYDSTGKLQITLEK